MAAIGFVQVCSTRRAQPAASFGAQRVEGKGEHDRIPDDRLEVNLFAFDPVGLVLGALPGVEKDIIQLDVQGPDELLQATSALDRDVTFDRPGNVDTVHQRFQAKIEVQGRAFPHARQRNLDPIEGLLPLKPFGCAGTTQQLRDIYGE
jgi:hypothetical protein